jgi:phosphonate transport system permease protein
VLPQVKARLAAFTLYQFEVNVRATAMVGFVGAGGIGDALDTAISLFHMQDLTLLLITMLLVVSVVDAIGDRTRTQLLKVKTTMLSH